MLPLYVVFERFDFTLLEAARDLGARGGDVLRRVLLPLTRSGIASGALLVFVPALGEFMIPDLLGGARTLLLGNLITEQFLKARDWPFGAALAVLLVFVLVATSYAQSVLTERGGRMANPDERLRPSPPVWASSLAAGAYALLFAPLVTVVVYSFLVPTPTDGGAVELRVGLEHYERLFANAALGDALLISVESPPS